MKTMRETMNRTPIVIPMIAPVESVDLLLVSVEQSNDVFAFVTSE